MDEKLYLEIVTPEKVLFKGDVISVNVPGISGRFSILKNHAPIIAALNKGVIKVEGRFSEDFEFECISGIVECLNNEVTVLLEK